MIKKLKTKIGSTITVHIEYGQIVKTFKGTLLEANEDYILLEDRSALRLINRIAIIYIEL